MKKIKQNGSECTIINTQKNEKIVENSISKEVSEVTITLTKPVVNVKVEFTDSFRTYYKLEMVATIQYLNELIKENFTLDGNDLTDLYNEAIDCVFNPIKSLKNIQKSVLQYVCIDEDIQEKISSNQNGEFEIYTNIDIYDDEITSFSTSEANCRFCGLKKNKNFIPITQIGSADVKFSTESILGLLHNVDSGFYKNLIKFIYNNNVTTHSFTEEQLWDIFPLDEEICPGLLYDSLELLESYKLIEIEWYLNEKENEINVISLNKDDIQSIILKKKENKI